MLPLYEIPYSNFRLPDELLRHGENGGVFGGAGVQKNREDG
jgi:hypothetical protein